MNERERQRPIRPAGTDGAAPPDGEEDTAAELGSLLEAANRVVAERLSSNSRQYLRSAAQHGGQ